MELVGSNTKSESASMRRQKEGELCILFNFSYEGSDPSPVTHPNAGQIV